MLVRSLFRKKLSNQYIRKICDKKTKSEAWFLTESRISRCCAREGCVRKSSNNQKLGKNKIGFPKNNLHKFTQKNCFANQQKLQYHNQNGQPVHFTATGTTPSASAPKQPTIGLLLSSRVQCRSRARRLQCPVARAPAAAAEMELNSSSACVTTVHRE